MTKTELHYHGNRRNFVCVSPNGAYLPAIAWEDAHGGTMRLFTGIFQAITHGVLRQVL